MATITHKGNQIETIGNLPVIGSKAADFVLTKTDLSDVSLSAYAGKRVVLNIFPSIDTGVCAASVRKFNQELSNLENTVVLCISKDLPFAHKRFCEAEGLKNVVPLSLYKHTDFEKSYGVLINSGVLKGLLSRAVVVINQAGEVVYSEQVPEIGQEPDYQKAIQVLQS